VKAIMSKTVLLKRFFWILGICAIQSLYFPINLRMTGGIVPKTSFDIFPVIPIWVLPYLVCFPLWLFCLAWIILKMDNRTFKAVVAAFLLSLLMAVSTFVLFPTYVIPPKVISTGVFADLLRFVNLYAGGYNAFPSGHVYITTLIALFFGHCYPRQKWIWMAVVIIVSLSTLFTGQHYLVDVLGGLLVALMGFHFGLWWAGLLPATKGFRGPGLSILRHPR
jgi:membrane-associated phospholipid phosphatase